MDFKKTFMQLDEKSRSAIQSKIAGLPKEQQMKILSNELLNAQKVVSSSGEKVFYDELSNKEKGIEVQGVKKIVTPNVINKNQTMAPVSDMISKKQETIVVGKPNNSNTSLPQTIPSMWMTTPLFGRKNF